LPTRQRNEMSFRFTRHFPLLGSFGLRMAVEGLIKSLFKKSSPHAPNGGFTNSTGAHDVLIAPAQLALEQDMSVFDAPSWRVTMIDERF
jgi:hypothetical protein